MNRPTVEEMEICKGCGKKTFEEGDSWTDGLCAKCEKKILEKTKVCEEGFDLFMYPPCTEKSIRLLNEAWNEYIEKVIKILKGQKEEENINKNSEKVV